MKRDFYQKVASSNADFAIIQNFWNLANTHVDFRSYKIETTINGSTDVDYVVKYIDALTDASTTSTSGTITPGVAPTATITLELETCQSFNGDDVFATVCIRFAIAGGWRSERHTIFSLDAGATWTQNLNDFSSTSFDNIEDGYPTFYVNGNYYRGFNEVIGGTTPLVRFVRADLVTPAAVNGPNITDVDSFYSGPVIGSEYLFVYVEITTLDVCIGAYNPGGGGFTKKETLVGISAPLSYNNEKQIYWKKGFMEVIVDNTYLNMRYNGGSWSNISVSVAVSAIGIIWTWTFVDFEVAAILWNKAIWELTDKTLKKIQALEPRDYKKVYLTNLPASDNLTGVVQFQDGNGNDDLTHFTDSSGANCTLSIEELLDGHKNVFKCDDQNAAASCNPVKSGLTEVDPTYELFMTNSDDSGGKYFRYYINGDGGQNMMIITFESGNIFYHDAAGAITDIGDYSALKFIHLRLFADTVNDQQTITINTVEVVSAENFYLNRTTTQITGYHFLTESGQTGFQGYFDALGRDYESYVLGSNKKINAFVGYGEDIDEAWFTTGDADTGIMQLSLKDYTVGSKRPVLQTAMYKPPKYIITRTTEPFEDEWLKQYTDAGQLFYEGKIKDNNNDFRFFWVYLMKFLEDEYKETKITVNLIQKTYKEFFEHVIDNFSKYMKYGRGTNADVNTFTANQIDGTDADWANTDGASCTSSLIAKKVFINGVYRNLLEQSDNNAAAKCILTLTNISTLLCSLNMASTDIVEGYGIAFYEGATRIGILRLAASNLDWYNGVGQTIVAAVNNTMYHVVLVFSATDDDVDIYLNGVFSQTESLENNITTSINKIDWTTPTAGNPFKGYCTDLYIATSLINAMHTFSSISPLLTTKHNFKLKNYSHPAIQKLIAEETGYIVSVRPDGMVYVDQYAPSGNTIDVSASPLVGITFQGLLKPRNEKFSLITFYGGFINGKQIFSQGFGEPNFGEHEDWFPMIQGQDPGDIYFDADGNPKSLRLDGMVSKALTDRNIRIKRQIIGKRGIGLIHIGTSHTYNNDHYKIPNETWYAWRKNTYFPISDDNRLEHADSLTSPTKSDPDDTPIEKINSEISNNAEQIVKVEQISGQIEEDINDSDGQGITPAWGNVDSNENFGPNPNVRNFDANLTGWTGYTNANSTKTYNATLNNKKHTLTLMAGDADETLTLSSIGDITYISTKIRADVIDKDKQFMARDSGNATVMGIQMDATGVWQIWVDGAWLSIKHSLVIDIEYHVACFYDKIQVIYWIDTHLVYIKSTTDSNATDELVYRSTENNDGNEWFVTTYYYGSSLFDAFSSYKDGSFQSKQIITEKISGALRTDDLLTAYIEENARNLDERLWGLFESLVAAGAVSSGSPQAATAGCHRIMLVVIAGADVSGTVTITGNTRDRTDTSILTVADTENITISGLSTDNTSTDAQGNTIHEFVNVYISDNWFEGTISISTTDVDINDLDVYAILYHQFDGFQSVLLRSFDITLYCTNTAGWFYSYLYLVKTVNSSKKYDIEKLVDHNITVAISTANKGYRRRTELNRFMDANAGDGVWGELHFGPAASTYWQDISVYIKGLLDGADPNL